MRLSINGIVVEGELNDIESHYRKSIFWNIKKFDWGSFDIVINVAILSKEIK